MLVPPQAPLKSTGGFLRPEATHLLIEPLEEFSKHLQQIASEYDAHYIAAVATSKSGRASLNVHPDLDGSSLLKECEESDVNGIVREVPSVTVDELCRELCLTGPYLIKVDVQGTELDVLAGAAKVLDEAEVVVLEVSLFRFFGSNPEIYEVLSYMKERHFVAYDIFGGHYRPVDNALAQVDIVFVKEHGQFRKEHFYATQEQRTAVTKRLRSRS